MILNLNGNQHLSAVSRVISFLRFPLIILVIFIHCNFSSVNVTFASQKYAVWLSTLVSDTIAQVANPAFFFISGLLFFHEGTFSISIYKRKLKKRFRSLLIPYVVWNGLFLVVLLGVELIIGHNPEISKPETEMNFADFICAFWDISLIGNQGGLNAPVDIPLWFVRDLMVIVLLSPIVFWVVKAYSKIHIYVQLGLLLPLFYCIDNCQWWPEMVTPVVFFLIGAYFSLNRIDICYVFRRMDAALLMSIILAFFYRWNTTAYLLMIFFAFGWLGKKAEKGQLPVSEKLESSVFFIFAYHALAVAAVSFLLKYGYIPVDTNIKALICYIITPFFIAAIGVWLSTFLKRYCHPIYAILCGNR